MRWWRKIKQRKTLEKEAKLLVLLKRVEKAPVKELSLRLLVSEEETEVLLNSLIRKGLIQERNVENLRSHQVR